VKGVESAKKKISSNGSSTKKASASRYVVCVENQDYPASLELRKIYRIIPGKTAANSGLLRVIDESGEDYLYPSDCFVAIKLPPAVERAVRLVSWRFVLEIPCG
jgi:hypothetical protein